MALQLCNSSIYRKNFSLMLHWVFSTMIWMCDLVLWLYVIANLPKKHPYCLFFIVSIWIPIFQVDCYDSNRFHCLKKYVKIPAHYGFQVYGVGIIRLWPQIYFSFVISKTNPEKECYLCRFKFRLLFPIFSLRAEKFQFPIK